MAEFILIPGRTALREKALAEGSIRETFLHEAATLQMNAGDLARLGVTVGDMVRVRSSSAAIELPCEVGDLPSGIVWIAQSELSGRLLDDETDATGMPTSKGIDVSVEPMGR